MALPLAKYALMDPYILVSAVNMALRDEYSSLDDLCKAYEIEQKDLCKKLKKAGFIYNQEQNQFK